MYQSNCTDILSFFIGAVFTEKNGAYFDLNHKLLIASFLFFTEVPNVKYSDRVVFIKYRKNTRKNL